MSIVMKLFDALKGALSVRSNLWVFQMNTYFTVRSSCTLGRVADPSYEDIHHVGLSAG